MAESDKIQFAVSMTPCEMVGASSEGSTENFIAHREYNEAFLPFGVREEK